MRRPWRTPGASSICPGWGGRIGVKDKLRCAPAACGGSLTPIRPPISTHGGRGERFPRSGLENGWLATTFDTSYPRNHLRQAKTRPRPTVSDQGRLGGGQGAAEGGRSAAELALDARPTAPTLN